MQLTETRTRQLMLILAATLVTSGCENQGSSNATLAAAAPAEGNLIANPGFEQGGDGAPAGWTFEERVRSKGKLRQVGSPVHEGVKALRLEPNSKNADGVHPLAVGQGFPIDAYRGKKLALSAWLGAEGGTTAVAGLYTIKPDGSIVQSARLTQIAAGNELSRHDTTLDIPRETDAIILVLACAANGTDGAAIFDDVSVSIGSGDTATVATPAGEPLKARVKVDATGQIRRIPSTLYGTNIEWIYDGYGLWDGQRNALTPELVDLTRELHPSLIRFPGGVFADFYHWRDGVGPRNARKETRHTPGAATSRHNFGTDEALDLARRVDGELLITVNAGTGTPAEAVDWIRYVNKGGKTVVRYWEVGNEIYGVDESPATKEVSMPPDKYAARFVEFAKAMRAADPQIRIGAIGNEPYGRYKMNGYPGWNREVLIRGGDHMDFFAMHNAYAPLMFVDRGEDVRTVYAAMLAAPVLIGENLRTVSRQIEQYAPGRKDHIKLAVTEWGPWFHADPSSRYVDHVKTLGSALFVASTLKVFIEHPNMDVANTFKLVDNAFMGWIGLRNGKYVPKAPYYALQMFSRHFGAILVPSRTESPTYDSPAAGLVDSVRGVPWFETVVSRSEDGGTLYIMAINKHFDSPAEAEIELDGFSAAGGTVWTLGGSAIDAHTGTELPKIPGLKWADQTPAQSGGRFRQGGPGEVRLNSTQVDLQGDRFRYTFEPHSVTCLELRRGRATTP